MTIEPSERVDRVPPSGIRRFFELAEARDDVISLGVGEPDFSAPWAAREAAITALERGRTSYTANRGRMDLRELIVADSADSRGVEWDPETEVLVTAGASEGIDLACRALVDPGDTVAVAEPTYVSYVPAVRFAGGEVCSVPTRPAESFALTYDRLAAADADEADVLLYCDPNNPTGARLSDDQIRGVAEFAREHDLTVLADEIYAELVYDGDHTSIASLPGMRERTVVFDGFSKAYAMTGMRLGYALGPPTAIRAMNRVHQYTMLSAPTTAQAAAVEALENCRDAVADAREEYDRRRNFLLSRFADLGIDCVRPRGAFYAFPAAPGGDAEAFAEALLEEAGVAVVPGGVFGAGGEGHLRVSYATGLPQLREATRRLEAFLADW
ncbi:pyridoxal phosphate-dependent aminotransferase [Halobaculum sp. MBLA0143]|uniref:pyridoxal phosphate-dependent aminotransferase n=1 Tax=Halobaculum sp. MBLA0143 TaxID=3079933 RepID=UPI0035236DE5